MNMDATQTRDEVAQQVERLNAAAPELLAACKLMKERLHKSGLKLNVRKHFSLLVADAALGSAIHKAEHGE
jgi:hypothetical protein